MSLWHPRQAHRLLLALGLCAVAPRAWAVEVPLEVPVAATLEAGEMGAAVVVLETKDGSVRVPSPVPTPTGLSAETVSLREGAKVAILRVAGPSPGALVIRVDGGRPVIAWSGATGWVGEGPHARREELFVHDVTGDGHADVFLAEEHRGAPFCGAPTGWAGAARYRLYAPAARPKGSTGEHPDAFRFVSPARRPLGALVVVPASATPPPSDLADAAAVRTEDALRWQGASSGQAEALGDGNERTAWFEDRPGPGRGEFVTARIARPALGLSALEGVLPQTLGPWARPTSLLLEFGLARSVRVDLSALPPEASRFWLPLEGALAGAQPTCVTLVIEGAEAKGTAQAATQQVGLAELRAFTRLESASGLAALLQEHARGSLSPADRDALARGLAAQPGAADVLTAWGGDATPLGARLSLARSLRLASASGAVIQAALGEAWQDANEFDDLWRLFEATPAEGASPALVARAREEAAHHPHWAIRHAALLAWLRAAPAERDAVVGDAALDRAPRIRAWAVADAALPEATRIDALKRDAWPLVRLAAAGALTSGAGAIAALRDPSPRVRAAAFERAAARGIDAPPLREAARAAVQKEASDRALVLAAISFLRARCDADATPALLARVRRGASPGASEVARELGAEALATLAVLPGRSADNARKEAAIAARGGPLEAELSRAFAAAARCTPAPAPR